MAREEMGVPSRRGFPLEANEANARQGFLDILAKKFTSPARHFGEPLSQRSKATRALFAHEEDVHEGLADCAAATL